MDRLSLYWDTGGDVEDIRKYSTGGFHPIRLGDVVSSQKSQYRVLHKLGGLGGAFSTAWLAETLQEPSQCYVALKICIADAHPNHELEIFNKVSCMPSVPPNVVQLLDHFSLQGPKGVHTVLVQNVLGSFMDFVRPPNGPGRKHVRILCRDITVGLAALHRRRIVHGDLHAGNVGIFLPSLSNHPPSKILDYFDHPECTIVLPTTHPAHPGALPPYLAQIMDLGNAIIVNEQTRPACTPPGVCAPELMFERVALQADLGSPPTQASDIWSLACTIYELVFGGGIFYFASWNDTLLGSMATLCGEVPQGWKGYWESRELLRSLCWNTSRRNREYATRRVMLRGCLHS